MANVGELTAHVKANVRDFTAKMGEVMGTVQRTEARFASLGNASRLMQAALTGAAATAAVKFFNIGVQSEAMGLRYRAVFGENTAALDEWVQNNRTSFGMAVDDMQGLVAQVANQLTPLGLTATQAGETATKILELAAAWSTWSGGQITAEAAASALTKGVMGQTRGLVELGMNAAVVRDIESELTATMENGAEPADLLEQSMARLNLITEQSGPALEVHREAMEGAAGAQRAAQTAINELKDSFGEAIVQLSPLVRALSGLLNVLGDIPGLVGVAGGAMMGFMVGGPVGAVIGGLVGLSTQMVGVGSAARQMGELITAAMGGSEDAVAQLSAAAAEMSGVFAEEGEQAAWAVENMDLLRDAADTVEEAVGQLARDTFPEWIAATQEAGDTVRDLGPDYEQMIEQFRRHSRAVDESTRSLQELADEQRAAVDPVFGMMDALDDAAQAQREYSAALATGDLEAMEQAEIDAMNALIGFDQAAADFDMGQAIETVRSMGERLQWSAEQTQGWIDRIIALNNTDIVDKSFTITAFMHDQAGAGPLIGGRQHGGPVYPGDAAIVGEAGPELLTVSGAGAMVTPLGKLPKLGGGGRLSGGGKGDEYIGMKLPSKGHEYPGMKDVLAGGMPGGMTAMQAASFERMGWALPEMGRKIEAIAARPAGSGVGNVINVYVTVEGSIRSDRELAKVVEAELVRAVRRGGASEILS